MIFTSGPCTYEEFYKTSPAEAKEHSPASQTQPWSLPGMAAATQSEREDRGLIRLVTINADRWESMQIT